jgi:hypothetical protein
MAPFSVQITQMAWQRSTSITGDVLLPGNYSVDFVYVGGSPLNIKKTTSCADNDASHPFVRPLCRKPYKASNVFQMVENEAFMIAVDLKQPPLNVSSSFQCTGMIMASMHMRRSYSRGL